jgi:hypothetical protein
MSLESLQFASRVCRDRGVRVTEVLLRASWEGRRVHDLGYALLLVRVAHIANECIVIVRKEECEWMSLVCIL